MANSLTQNPRNKVGRNSGVGAAGIRAVVPSAAEARRGLRPFELDDRPSWTMRIGAGLGMLALVGGGALALARRRQERRRSVRGRMERLIHWR